MEMPRMQRKPVSNVGMALDLARRGVVGLVAGIVVAAIEAYPSFSLELSKRMLRRDFERLREEFVRQGADTSRLIELCPDPDCAECRKEMH